MMGMGMGHNARRRSRSRLALAGLLLAIAAGTAVAGATTLPSSTPQVYRESSEAAKLQGSGLDGTGVTVAVIDTGVANVPKLDGAVIHQQNLSAGPPDGDQHGHGTFVAGLVHYVAPGAKIVSVKLSGADGSVDVTQVLAALQWVVAHKDVYSIDVVNLSFGNSSKQSTKTSLLNYAVQKAWDAGIVVVVSAGNAGPDAGTVTKPGDDPLAITVGSTDEYGTGSIGDDTIPSFVSRGPTQDGLAKPDLVAPGSRLVSLRAPGSTIDESFPAARVGTDQFRGSGTSFSAPIVSGVVAQMLQAKPGLHPDQVKYGLRRGAIAVSGDPAAMGSGTVRAKRALSYVSGGKANGSAQRSDGSGSLDGDRGASVVEVVDEVTLVDGTIKELHATVTGERGSHIVNGTLADFDRAQYLEASSWGASQWGASQWGASQWGASQWGASSWGSSQWWASQWG